MHSLIVIIQFGLYVILQVYQKFFHIYSRVSGNLYYSSARLNEKSNHKLIFYNKNRLQTLIFHNRYSFHYLFCAISRRNLLPFNPKSRVPLLYQQVYRFFRRYINLYRLICESKTEKPFVYKVLSTFIEIYRFI